MYFNVINIIGTLVVRLTTQVRERKSEREREEKITDQVTDGNTLDQRQAEAAAAL